MLIKLFSGLAVEVLLRCFSISLGKWLMVGVDHVVARSGWNDKGVVALDLGSLPSITSRLMRKNQFEHQQKIARAI
jgi:hypothetical protein